jgi:hypothetical protein
VPLRELTVDYYLTNELTALTLIKAINWANIGQTGGANSGIDGTQCGKPSNQSCISIDVLALANSTSTADSTVTFGFSGGSQTCNSNGDCGSNQVCNPSLKVCDLVLKPGYRVQFSWTVQNYQSQNFDQSNDYSFDSSASSPKQSDHIVIYRGASVIWGQTP